jgi:hypothetical protein
MAEQRLFGESRTVYWPAEFGDLINMLKGLDVKGQPAHHPMYRYNTGPIVLAAMLGLFHNREREVGPQRQEINTDTFESHKFGNSTLSTFILLIPLIGTQDVELLRPEREDELIRKFERYAAGGLEYLRGAMATSADSSGEEIILSEIKQAIYAIDDVLGKVQI